MKKKIIDRIFDYIKTTYDINEPFILKELYDAFSEVKHSTIRESVRRLYKQDKLIRVKNGMYGLPNPNRILQIASLNSEDAVNRKYIMNEDGTIVGYRSGFYIANALRLTTQTSSDLVIYSNVIAKKKRTVRIKNINVVINQARVHVTNKNYKLLQVLDLLIDFKKYSENTLKDATSIICNYLDHLELNENDIEAIVDQYPKDAQIRFYKMGGYNAFTHR